MYGVKTKLSNMKGHMVLGDTTPRTKINLLDTFVSIRYSNYFINKSAKKIFWTCLNAWLFLHSMSCKHALIRHNILTLLQQALSKKTKRTQFIPKFSQKTKKNPPRKLWNVKTCLKWRTWGVKIKNVKKFKKALGSGGLYSQNQE